MREEKSIGINYDKLSYAILSPIGGLGLIGGITKNDYPYVNNGQFFALVIFMSITLTIYFFLKSFNVLIINSYGIELKYLLFPSKSIKKRWKQIDNYAIVRIKRKGSKKQITYSRTELWFIDSNDIVLFKTYKKGRTNLNQVIRMIDRFINRAIIDLEKTDTFPLSKRKHKVIYKKNIS
jgi:hypothetical protein